MKAVVNTKYGPPDVLHIRDVEKPVPKENEVLIKVHATTVNRTDCGLRAADPFIVRFFTGILKPKYTVLGTEIAGEVEAIGSRVTLFKKGDQVFGLSGIKCGAHAEYVCLPETAAIVEKPANMSYEESAAVCDGMMLAYNYLRRMDIQKRNTILINGTTGSIGTAGVQMAKYFGAEITAVCNTKNIELVKSLGSDEVIDYLKDDFTKTDRTFDYVFDAVGKSSFFRCRHLLRDDGIYCSTDLGFLAQNIYLPMWTKKFGTKKVIFPIPKASKKDVAFFKEIIEAGKYKAVIDRTYPLDRIVEAYEYVEKGEKTGNVVITVT